MTPHKTRHHAALDADGLKDLLAKVKASEDEAPVTRLGLLVLAHTALTATTTDATSTVSDTTTASTSSTSASSTPPATDASSTPATPPAQTQTPDQGQAQSQPSRGAKPTLKLVRVVGTKYIDYFTDGTKTYSFPGNPDVDSNLNKPNAPIPTRGNLQWVYGSLRRAK